MTSGGGSPRALTADEERERDLAQRREEQEQRDQQQRDENERKQLSSSLLSRIVHFSRSPPPSTADAHPTAAARVLTVLFLSSTNSVVPHFAAALTNVTHGDHIRARWSTSHEEGPLVDEHASGAMEEFEVARARSPTPCSTV